MTAITDLSDLINLSTGGNSGTPENLFFYKSARIAGAAATAPIAGRPASLWRYDGSTGPGAVPGAVSVPDNTTDGGLKQTNPGGSREKWLTQVWATGLVGGTLILYDRLLHIGGLSGTATAGQNVGGTLTRYTDGIGNIAFIEVNTIIGTTATTVVMNYTNQSSAGATGPAVAIGGTGFREVTRAIFLPLAAGDTGIMGVTDIDLTASTTTVGNIGVVVAHPLAYIGIGTSGAAGWRDFVTGLPGIRKIETDACLALLWIPTTTTAPEIFGGISTVEK